MPSFQDLLEGKIVCCFGLGILILSDKRQDFYGQKKADDIVRIALVAGTVSYLVYPRYCAFSWP